jgi:chromosome partitioning protein
MAILPTAHTIAVLSQKGGTGKTTLVRTLADVLQRAGLDVLAIDLDPQGNLSDYFDLEPDISPTIGEVLSGRAHISEAIHDGVVPANLGLAEAELVLSGKMGREMTLKRALREPRREHDVILIDCPPALGLLTVNALVAASHAMVSAEGEYFSLQGVEQVLEVMGLARENLNEELEWLGVVLNMMDLRTLHAREARASLRASFGDKLFDTVIRKSVRYPESAERALSILDYRPELGTDYISLGEEVLTRLGEEDARSRVSALRPAEVESERDGHEQPAADLPPTPAAQHAPS